MRTTIDIDDDVLLAVKEISKRESRSAGKVASELLRRALTSSDGVREGAVRYGFRPFAKRGGIVTNEIIDRLSEEDGE